MAYPTGVKIFIDGKDATYYLFGVQTLNPDAIRNTWRNVDLTTYLRKHPGVHTVQITSDSGAGRVDARVEIR